MMMIRATLFLQALTLLFSSQNQSALFASSSPTEAEAEASDDERNLQLSSGLSLSILWSCATTFTPASDEECRELMSSATNTDCDCFAFCDGEQQGCLQYDETGEYMCPNFDLSKLCRAEQAADYQPPPQEEEQQEDTEFMEDGNFFEAGNSTNTTNATSPTALDAFPDQTLNTLQVEAEALAESSARGFASKVLPIATVITMATLLLQ